MNITTSRMQQWKKNISRYATIIFKNAMGSQTGVEPRLRRRLRLLSAFLLLLTFITLACSLSLKNIGGNSWIVMLATSVFLFFSYLISRTRFYRVAIVLAVTIPAIAPLAIVIFKPPEVNLTAELMWLALPLLISSLMLSIRKTIIVAVSYITSIIIFAFLGSLGFETIAPLMAYMLTSAFFVITITDVREKNQLEIENQLKERKRMENALINEATRRRILIEQSRDGIVVLDQNGKVYEANQRFVDMLGYSPEELSKLHVWDWDAYQTREKLLDRINNIDEAGDHFETKHRHKDGTVYDIELSTNGAMFAGQKLIFCVCRDITERKRAEEALKLALTSLEHSTAQLQATNKELESFSYSVSHDLRSPLRSIDGFSQALLEDYANTLDEKGQDYLKRLRSASQKMGELIDGLLKLSRVTRSELHQEKIDLGTLAKDIFDRLKETDHQRRVKVTIGDDLVTNGDSQMVRALLENLLGNAWKFTAKTQHAKIELGRGVNGDKNTFFIKDNGAGFDMAFKDKLFGAFQRLHDTAEFPGTGIGLATVQRIINRHGGNIRAEAKVGKGATFYFTLNERA